VIGSKIIQLIDGQTRERAIGVAADFLSGIRAALDHQSVQHRTDSPGGPR
jgi:hypothetical protein